MPEISINLRWEEIIHLAKAGKSTMECDICNEILSILARACVILLDEAEERQNDMHDIADC